MARQINEAVLPFQTNLRWWLAKVTAAALTTSETAHRAVDASGCQVSIHFLHSSLSLPQQPKKEFSVKVFQKKEDREASLHRSPGRSRIGRSDSRDPNFNMFRQMLCPTPPIIRLEYLTCRWGGLNLSSIGWETNRNEKEEPKGKETQVGTQAGPNERGAEQMGEIENVTLPWPS